MIISHFPQQSEKNRSVMRGTLDKSIYLEFSHWIFLYLGDFNDSVVLGRSYIIVIVLKSSGFPSVTTTAALTQLIKAFHNAVLVIAEYAGCSMASLSCTVSFHHQQDDGAE